MNKIYENRYGRLEVEPVSLVMPVRDIRGENFPDDIKFNLETAEQVVLITENRLSQVAFQEWTAQGRAYLVVHESRSAAYVVRIVSLDYRGPNAQEEIVRLKPVAVLI